jgi:hypothetical protein
MSVPLWGRFEQVLQAERPATESDVELWVEFTAPGGRTRRRRGFWDGGQTWRARFMPDQPGQWQWRSLSSPAVMGLHGRKGTFTVHSAMSGHRFLRHGPLRLSADRHHLEHADGTRFFFLADTAWNGPMLSAEKDWDVYLHDRVAKRFNAIQYVNHAPWRAAQHNAEQLVAFAVGNEGMRINAEFYRRMDDRIDALNAHGLLAVPVLLWAWGPDDPGRSLCDDDAIRLMRYQIARYGAHHVMWIPAGDGKYEGETAARWKRLCRAVFEPEEDRQLVVMHPGRMQWPFDEFRQETWLDVIGYQSGHRDTPDNLRWIHSGPAAKEWKRQPVRPVINLEPPYEAHGTGTPERLFDDAAVRRATYWSGLIAPPAGVTYGAHGIWSWEEKAGIPLCHPTSGFARPWHEAIHLPGSMQVKHLADLMDSLPWHRLRPAPQLLAVQPGEQDPASFIAAAATEDARACVIYLPAGGEVALASGPAEHGATAEWFNPRTGERWPARSASPDRYSAPDGQDWVLTLRRE